MSSNSSSPKIHYQGQQFAIEPQESLLEALLRQGQDVPYSCRKGSCLTCTMKLESGEVEHSRSVDANITSSGHILCCVAYAKSDVQLAPADMTALAIDAEIIARTQLTDDIYELQIAPMRQLDFRPGQHVRLIRRSDDLSRQYSIASQADGDFFFRVHLRCLPDGQMSPWLCQQASVGERLQLVGPTGKCHYTPEIHADRPLLMLSTGTGGSALLAIARDALTQGHAQPIHFYHGVRQASELYLLHEMRELAAQYPQFQYHACISQGEAPEGTRAGRITQAFVEDMGALDEYGVFLCGNPLMVEDARFQASLKGARRRLTLVDPFESSYPPAPRDAEKIASIEPQPELWEALDRGEKLSKILKHFYDMVYEDDRLSPYFHGIPKEFVAQKVYEFFASLFGRETGFFGRNPYNTHHWMVISNDMFDHHEALLEKAIHAFGVPDHLIRRWMAINELFRSEIVKSAPRGMISAGVEQPVKTHEVSVLEMDTICDGCGNEIPAGQPVRYHHRVGTLHCAHCAGIDVSSFLKSTSTAQQPQDTRP
ncbi:hypothetical protein CO608_05700 [Lysobacteraceae bacterium NML08-0793]|nr:hypothetical protein CO608_05700 [Xanthomonadaceae bacterium NML08-0793]